MQKIYILLSALLVAHLSFSQNTGTLWYFGDHAAVTFQSGNAIATDGGSNNNFEGTAVAADADGNPLFYTDGTKIWNKGHTVMENGDGLLGGWSSSQSSVIVQKPQQPDIFYVFTTSSGNMSNALCYTEVDLSLNGGLGAVTANKNIVLVDSCTEQQTVIKHANGEDFWVVSHGFPNDAFHAIKVTALGVNPEPVTTVTGQVFTDANDRLGYMNTSESGDLIVMANNATGIQTAGFDAATGQITHCQFVKAESGMYGAEISSSGQFLYVSYTNGARVAQYNLFSGDVTASETTVFAGSFNVYIGGALKRGPDGKIYFSISGRNFLSVINNPDNYGAASNFTEDGLALLASAFTGLPFAINAIDLTPKIEAKNLCHGDVTEFTVTPPEDITAISWDFGNGHTAIGISPEYSYPLAGTYTVTAIITRAGNTETIVKTVTIIALPLIQPAQDMYGCDYNGNGTSGFNLEVQSAIVMGVLNPSGFVISYHLTAEDAQSGVNPLEYLYTNTQNPQIIYIRVQSPSGCYAETSFRLVVHPKPVVDMEDEYFICREGGSVSITAPPGFAEYWWSTGESERSITIEAEGKYMLHVSKDYGDVSCEAEKEITVHIAERPEIQTIEVDDWNAVNNKITVITVKPGNYEYSLDGINYQAGNVFTGLSPGLYNVYVRNNCGRDADRAAVLMYPKFFTPNGDGKNETWQINFAHFEPLLKVSVYDRYGKLISSFKGADGGWDGTFSGSRLPSTDYWFVVERENGKFFKGHFSLLR